MSYRVNLHTLYSKFDVVYKMINIKCLVVSTIICQSGKYSKKLTHHFYFTITNNDHIFMVLKNFEINRIEIYQSVQNRLYPF